ncbi:MAG: M73 family metallopeptidase [Chloroflexi bacterium]|nr:M73 family metallopeptidase [Chloroflexota bacterium]
MQGKSLVRRVLWGFLLIGAVSTMFMLGAMAVFTDQATSPANAFTAGTVDVALTPATAMFTVTQMAPGNVNYSGLQVTNSGNLALRYAMTTTPDGSSALDEQLDLTIDVVTGAGLDGTWYTADDTVGEAAIYGADGVLSAAAFGNPTQGNQAGDRNLAASGSERLRFKVTLPVGTGNAYQGTSATVAFVYDAEQTTNNP